MPTGLPDCISNDSSFSKIFNALMILSSASKFLAAFPRPPYTINSSGFSATSGSRLLSSMRNAASCIHPLQESFVPVGVLYLTGSYFDAVFMVMLQNKALYLYLNGKGHQYKMAGSTGGQRLSCGTFLSKPAV